MNEQSQNSLSPIGDLGSTAGYAGVASSSTSDRAASVAGKYRQDELLLGQLTDRVYQLLQADLDRQRERLANSSRSRW
jgi:hypothetical protein